MRNRHTDSGKWMPGKSTGQYRGQMKHGRAVEAFKDALHTEPSRNPVCSHAGQPAPGTPGTLADVSAKGATTFTGKGS